MEDLRGASRPKCRNRGHMWPCLTLRRCAASQSGISDAALHTPHSTCGRSGRILECGDEVTALPPRGACKGQPAPARNPRPHTSAKPLDNPKDDAYTASGLRNGGNSKAPKPRQNDWRQNDRPSSDRRPSCSAPSHFARDPTPGAPGSSDWPKARRLCDALVSKGHLSGSR